MDWLNANSGAVTAMVTAIYAFFTILLWFATRNQAKITRQIFEASHRPYLIPIVKEPTDTNVQNLLSFSIVFENQGTVPADIIAWELCGTRMDLDENWLAVPQVLPIPSPVGRSLAPHELAKIDVSFSCGDLPNPVLPFRLKGKVKYQGVASRTYQTIFDAQRVRERWEVQGHIIR